MSTTTKPYTLAKEGGGYKVQNKKTGKKYSKKPLSKEQAQRQRAAIGMHADTAEATTKPMQSQAQWGYLFSHDLPFAERWARETPGGKGKRFRKLPEHVPEKKSFDSSFVVYKDDTDAYRWMARTTTAYRDRDGEIITTKALDQDAQRMTATNQYGPLRYWHIGQPDPFSPLSPWGPGVDIGDCDYSIVIGRTSIESGTFKSHAIGKAFAENAQDYELSPGFFHPPNQPNAAGEYDNIRRFERSVVPIKYGRASNLFTGMTVKEERMDEATLKARVETFMRDMSAKGVPNQVVDNLLGGMQQADKSAQAWGIASKSDNDPWTAVAIALKAALMPAAPAAVMMAPPEEKDIIDDGDAPEDEPAEETEVVGDMTVADFEDMMGTICLNACTQAMQQFGSDIQGKMAALDDSLKTMGYARTKSEGEIAALKAEQERIANRLAELEGDKPVMVSAAEVEAVLKGAGPQAPKQPDALPVPTPDRPFAGWAAQTWPQLYKAEDGSQSRS